MSKYTLMFEYIFSFSFVSLCVFKSKFINFLIFILFNFFFYIYYFKSALNKINIYTSLFRVLFAFFIIQTPEGLNWDRNCTRSYTCLEYRWWGPDCCQLKLRAVMSSFLREHREGVWATQRHSWFTHTQRILVIDSIHISLFPRTESNQSSTITEDLVTLTATKSAVHGARCSNTLSQSRMKAVCSRSLCLGSDRKLGLISS